MSIFYGNRAVETMTSGLPANAVPRVAIVTVGSELTTGRIADTNAQWIAAALTRLGWNVVLMLSVDDEPAMIADALSLARARAGAVWVTGGLGPTADDLTAEVVADLLKVPLREDPATAARIRRWYAERGREPTPYALRMARIPAGAESLDNRVGSAPGVWIEQGGIPMLLTPGVPAEMKAIAEDSALARFAALGSPASGRTLRIAGLHEGGVDEAVREVWATLKPGERFALQIARGEVFLRLLVTGRDAAACSARLSELSDACTARLRAAVYGTDEETLEGVVVRELVRAGATVAAAESVTGGLLLGRLTAVPGASAVVRGGFVAYQDAAKGEWLGLSAEVLRGPGAVSAIAAEDLARGARERAHADWALSTTGWAGPGGPGAGTGPDAPGTVYVGLAGPHGVTATRFAWRGGRETIREYAVTAALDLLRRAITA